jgi:hypothetical protein
MIIDTTYIQFRQRLLSLAIVVLIMVGILLAAWLLFHQPVAMERSARLDRIERTHRCRDGGAPAVVELGGRRVQDDLRQRGLGYESIH